VGWKLWSGETTENYFTLFVPNDHVPDILSLKVLLGIPELRLMDTKAALPAVMQAVAFDFHTAPIVPPIFPPFVVHRDLLYRAKGDPAEFYVWGTTREGLWKVEPPVDDSDKSHTSETGAATHDVAVAFQELLGAHDTYFLEASLIGEDIVEPNGNHAAWASHSRQDLPPIAEEVLAWLIGHVTDDPANALTFARSDPARVSELGLACKYWDEPKSIHTDESGDNAYFGTLIRVLESVLPTGAGEASSPELHLAATNFLLAARLGDSTWMLFPRTLAVYSRTYFPFTTLLQSPADLRHEPFRIRGREFPQDLDDYIAARRFLEYCRLTQFTQVDISDLADPRPEVESQTGSVLRLRVPYVAFGDVVEERRKKKSLGTDVDDELGIRSLCYMRLLPSPSADLPPTPVGQNQLGGRTKISSVQPLLYVFAHSPAPHWFAPTDSGDWAIRSTQWLRDVPSGAVSSLWTVAHNEWERRTTLANMVRELREKRADDEIVAATTERLGAVADKAHTVLFLEILSSYTPESEPLSALIESFTVGARSCAITEYRLGGDSYDDKATFLRAVKESSLGRRRFRIDRVKLHKVLQAVAGNAAERGRGAEAHAAVLATREITDQRLVGIALLNRLPRSIVPTISQYRRHRQLVPDHYTQPGSFAPRGMGLFLSRVALRAMTQEGDGDLVWLRVSLRRAGDDAEHANRPVKQDPKDGSLIPWCVEDYRNVWEAMLCLSS
jgi:hypothetical protein